MYPYYINGDGDMVFCSGYWLLWIVVLFKSFKLSWFVESSRLRATRVLTQQKKNSFTFVYLIFSLSSVPPL